MSGVVDKPTLSGFIAFAQNNMGITTTNLPADSVWYTYAFNVALEIVSELINCVSSLMYTLAVYNLAGDNLINFAPNTPPDTFFTTARENMKILSFVPGVVTATSDNGTSVGLLNPEAMKTFTLANLQNLKTPWGREYLAIAQRAGTTWGLT